jgi:hypothetical protein
MTLLAELRSWREQANWPWQRIASPGARASSASCLFPGVDAGLSSPQKPAARRPGALADELAQAIDTTIGVIRREFADATGHRASDVVSV